MRVTTVLLATLVLVAALAVTAASGVRVHRQLRRAQAAAAALRADAGAGDAALLQLQMRAGDAKPRDRFNRDRAAASSNARAAAHRAAAMSARASVGTGVGTRLARPANAPRAPAPPVPRGAISSQRLVRGTGHARARTNQPPPHSASLRPRFVATHTAGKAGAKAKDFVWTQEGTWHGLTAGEDDDALQPPWVDGPDPLPKKVAEPFTPPKAPTMGFQGDGRFYPPPPPPPPPPPSPYPPPPPPPPPGGGADAGPEGDDFVETSAHLHGGSSGDGKQRPRWIPPRPESLPANSVQFPFAQFPAPSAGPHPAQAQPTSGPGAASPSAAPPTMAGGFDATHTANSPAAPPAPTPTSDPSHAAPGFGLPSPSAAAPAVGGDDGPDSLAAFSRRVSAAARGEAIGGSLQAADAARLRQIEFEREMADAEREQAARDRYAAQLQAMQQQMAAAQQEPLSSASSAFGPAPDDFPTHAMQQPPM